MKTIEIKATDCKRISEKFLAREQKSMPKSHFQREYMCKFLSPHSGIFDGDAVERAFRPLTDNPFTGKKEKIAEIAVAVKSLEVVDVGRLGKKWYE